MTSTCWRSSWPDASVGTRRGRKNRKRAMFSRRSCQIITRGVQNKISGSIKSNGRPSCSNRLGVSLSTMWTSLTRTHPGFRPRRIGSCRSAKTWLEPMGSLCGLFHQAARLTKRISAAATNWTMSAGSSWPRVPKDKTGWASTNRRDRLAKRGARAWFSRLSRQLSHTNLKPSRSYRRCRSSRIRTSNLRKSQ